MKGTLLFLILSMLSVWSIAQDNRYAEDRQFKLDDCIYQCTIDKSGMVDLYNAANILKDIPMMYKSGEPFHSPRNEGKHSIQYSEVYKKMASKCRGIIQNTFRRYKLKTDEFMIISLYLFPETGKVREVKFSFHYGESFGIISIEDFRVMELELKKDIQFPITNEGKKTNYVFYWWDQMP